MECLRNTDEDRNNFGPKVLRVATYNLERFTRASAVPSCKSKESKAKIILNVCSINPDIIAFQEIGDLEALLELRNSLKESGCNFSFFEFIEGSDRERHLALLSKHPFYKRCPHTKDTFVVDGYNLSVRRGFAQVTIQVPNILEITIFAVHLKSGNSNSRIASNEYRLQEARILREKIDAHFATNPRSQIIVLGDFNDTEDSPALRAISGLGANQLIDCRPAAMPPIEAADIDLRSYPNKTWTHFFDEKEVYSRIDFILFSKGLVNYWCAEKSYVLAGSGWRMASDHRPVVATFLY